MNGSEIQRRCGRCRAERKSVGAKYMSVEEQRQATRGGTGPLVQVRTGDQRGECRGKEIETEQRRDWDSVRELSFPI